MSSGSFLLPAVLAELLSDQLGTGEAGGGGHEDQAVLISIIAK